MKITDDVWENCSEEVVIYELVEVKRVRKP